MKERISLVSYMGKLILFIHAVMIFYCEAKDNSQGIQSWFKPLINFPKISMHSYLQQKNKWIR